MMLSKYGERLKKAIKKSHQKNAMFNNVLALAKIYVVLFIKYRIPFTPLEMQCT